jgi:signal transduction histidine kinase
VKPRLAIVFALLLLGPLAALGWLGARSARDEQQMVEHRFARLLDARLSEVAAGIARRVEDSELGLGRLGDFERSDAETLRELARSEPLVRQVFLLDPKGKLLHPPLDGPRSQAEDDFLTRTRTIWQAQDGFSRPTEGPDAQAGQADRGWYVWYWDRDVNLIHWRRAVDGRVLGIEVNRMALLAALIGELPGSDARDPATPLGRMELCDADGDALYAWGRYMPAPGEAAAATQPLRSPLGSWKLRYTPAPGEAAQALGRRGALGMASGLGALALAVAGLGVYFVRESGRELREARQRLSFVNQVSHELKTPLTNIRMYAELLEAELDDERVELRDYSRVIVSETERLSRLIANVLSFARQQRGKLALRRGEGDVDETIRQVVDQFRPSLGEREVAIELELAAGGPARFDADALGQILGNLLSNVEKYAAAGRRVSIRSERQGATVELRVADAGPGVPAQERDEIFQPFVRLSGAVTDGVAGTGIGLSIARELARLHGGDVRLGPSDEGACFLCTLDVGTPREKGDDGEGTDRRG